MSIYVEKSWYCIKSCIYIIHNIFIIFLGKYQFLTLTPTSQKDSINIHNNNYNNYNNYNNKNINNNNNNHNNNNYNNNSHAGQSIPET